MPLLETPDELAEYIADLAGIYSYPPHDDHPENCQCRICFCIEMKNRIKQSIENERRLSLIGKIISADYRDKKTYRGK